jgi:alanyl-tRNA synthetase
VVSGDDTVLLYRDDPYLLEFDARVVERREHRGRPAVVLDRTAFYAESGGQPWDTGTLGGARVVEVQHDGGRVVHVVEALPAADAVHGVVDAVRRRDHLQQHHGQHLLSRAFFDAL